jgi:hypothetical protein
LTSAVARGIRSAGADVVHRIVTVLAAFAVLVAVGGTFGAAPAGAGACGDPQVLGPARDLVAVTCPCEAFTNHSSYVRCVGHAASKAAHAHGIPKGCVAAVKRCASNSTCGRPGTVPCCQTDAHGKGRCTIKLRASSCHKQGTAGSACIADRPSCCDACAGGTCTATSTTSSSTSTTTSTTTTVTTSTTSTTGLFSRRATKTDVTYLADADLERLHAALLDMKLARWRYREEQPGRSHLGFIIDDVEPSPAVTDAHGDTVDLYGYASMAVAAIQMQAREIEALKREIAALERRAGTCRPARTR